MSNIIDTIPIPQFIEGDETSMTLLWNNFHLAENEKVFLQFKIPQLAWDSAIEVPVISGSNQQSVKINSDGIKAQIVDLEPGTPYCVRFVIVGNSEKKIGPETVFDTKPIGCGPKSKTKSTSCTIM